MMRLFITSLLSIFLCLTAVGQTVKDSGYRTGMGNMEGTCGALIGATKCRLLKGAGTGKVLRDCPDCVSDASEFLEDFLGD